MNREQIEKQLKALKSPRCDHHRAFRLYGADLRKEDLLTGQFRTWAVRFGKKRDVMDSQTIDRFAFESFLQHSRVLPFRCAGARLGMTEASLRRVLDKMAMEGILPYYDALGTMDKETADNFARFFPELFREMPDEHSEYCRKLHEAVRRELDIKVDALFCETSVCLHETPPEYARDFDALTSEPVSTKYQLWLDAGKPINLKPDVCSVKTYFLHEKLLKDHLFGDYDTFLENMKEKFEMSAGAE